MVVPVTTTQALIQKILSLTVASNSRAPGHALQPEKMLKFEFVGTDNEALTYEEVEIALLGLMKYTTVWDSGSKNDQVRMCTFRLFYEDNNWPFAEGSVRLTADSLAHAMYTS
ncbi:hypothetical protein HO133_006512 [Letharia lupina]|uniref:Uncharacterized protein n=1 Tax=Letharia lupina TaxID=560253 RepID=A0A8H6F6V2_9LECA|nr:uncharacterized protein HO133_006512 [Letharia lupina]KAF6217685.1 hypothetical protein HO133_006512 [Letharia lupina]